MTAHWKKQIFPFFVGISVWFLCTFVLLFNVSFVCMSGMYAYAVWLLGHNYCNFYQLYLFGCLHLFFKYNATINNCHTSGRFKKPSNQVSLENSCDFCFLILNFPFLYGNIAATLWLLHMVLCNNFPVNTIAQSFHLLSWFWWKDSWCLQGSYWTKGPIRWT